jgi:hypothetical protein
MEGRRTWKLDLGAARNGDSNSGQHQKDRAEVFPRRPGKNLSEWMYLKDSGQESSHFSR